MKDCEPLASVIVRSKNRVMQLKECLNSVIKQDYPNYEIIVVDDHSTDETPTFVNELIKQHKNKKIIYLLNAGEGRGVAFNTGIKQAKGEIIASLDSDSIAPPHWLSSLVKAIKEGANAADCKSYKIPYEYRSRLWAVLSTINHMIGPRIIQLALGVNPAPLLGGCGAISRKAIDIVGLFDEQSLRSEDLDYGIRFIKKGLKQKIVDVEVIHHQHVTTRLSEEGYFNSAYDLLKIILRHVDNRLRNKILIMIFIIYRFFHQLILCLLTKSIKPLEMSKGNLRAYIEWTKRIN